MVKTSIFERLSFTLLVLMVVVLPFIKGGMFDWVAPILIGGGLLMFITMATHKIFYTEISIKEELIWFVPLLVLTVWVALQLFVFPKLFGWYAIFAPEDIEGTFFEDFNAPIDLITSLQWMGYFYTYWCVAWVCANLNQDSIAFLLRSVVIVSGVIALYALIAHYGKYHTILGIWTKTDQLCCTTGTFVNRNHFANYLALCIPVALYYFFMKNRGDAANKFIFVVAVTYFIVVMSAAISAQSRTGITVVVLGVCAWYVYFLRHFERLRIANYVWYFVIALGCIGFMWVMWYGFDDLLQRFFQESMGEARKGFRHTMYSMPFMAWLLGIQPGVFSDVYSYYAPSDINFRLGHAHNDYLEFMLEIGFVGVALVLLSVFGLIRKVITSTNEYKIFVVPMIAVMVIHSFVDFSLHIPSNAIWFFCGLGFITNYRKNIEKPKEPSSNTSIAENNQSNQWLNKTKLTAKLK